MPQSVSKSIRPCVLIPFYNHGTRLVGVVRGIEPHSIPVLIVDDGSTEEESKEVLRELEGNCTVIRLPVNRGKGAALKAGFIYAEGHGFTHAICVDADGQHSCGDIPSFLTQISANPEALVLGVPQFDSSAPWERVWGRKLSTILVWAETHSAKIKDVLCGFRSYPLHITVRLLSGVKSSRMGFDIEILVRHAWAGTQVVDLPTSVVYPEDGRSHFRYFEDNIALILLHMKLLLGGLTSASGGESWFERKELGSKAGLKLLLLFYKVCGRKLTTACLYPIALVYLLIARSARSSCFIFQHQLSQLGENSFTPWRFALRRFFYFARSVMDSIRAWKGEIDPKQVVWHGEETVHSLIRAKKGAVVFTAHFGPVEASRALHRFKEEMTLYALMHIDNARKFREILDSVFPGAHSNVIEVSEMNIATFSKLQERLAGGAFLGLMADRVTPNSREKFIERSFLGKKAAFPIGPFLMASVLNVPVLLMLASYRKDLSEFAVEWSDISPDSSLPRQERIEKLADRYVQELEAHAKLYPEQFFNFFDFWKAPVS